LSGDVTGFGIVGSGMIAEYHRDAIRANAAAGAQLIAIAGHRKERSAEISRRFDAPCVTESALLEHPQVDAICICTPSGLHAEQAIRAAQAGKHVLIEKPIALSLEDADAVIATAAASHVTVGVVLQRRTDPVFRAIAEAIARDEFGRLTLGTITIPYHRPQSYYDEAPWRGTWAMDGGGVLMNQGIHLLDLLVWYLGDPISVQASVETLEHTIEVEDTLAACLCFASGALATITATTTVSRGAPHRLELYGTRGLVQVEGEAIVTWQSAGTPPKLASLAERSRLGASASPRGIMLDGHIAIVRDFVDALASRRAPLVDAREARRALAAALAIYRVARGGAGSSLTYGRARVQ
jgi:UDP-N-acetyl-2-amino-2-deoxyglucuronate dehydrogenase